MSESDEDVPEKLGDDMDNEEEVDSSLQDAAGSDEDESETGGVKSNTALDAEIEQWIAKHGAAAVQESVRRALGNKDETSSSTTRTMSESLLNGIMEASMDAIIVANQQGVVIQFNEEARVLFDLPTPTPTPTEEKTEIELMGLIGGGHAQYHKEYLQSATPESIRRILSKMRDVKGRKYSSGEEFPVQVKVEMIVSPDDAPPFFVAVCHNLTDTKTSRAEADREAHMNQSILDSSFDAIVVSDDEGNIVKVNAAMLEIFGFDNVENVVGQNLEILVGEHAAMHRTYMKAFMEKGGSTSLLGTKRQLVAIRPDKSEFPVRIGIRKVAGTELIVAFIQDITNESRVATAESNAALQMKQAQTEAHMNQSILDSSFDAIIVSDDEGNIVKVNSVMLQVFGFDTIEEIVGQNLEILVGEHAAMHRSYMKAFLEKGGSNSMLGTKRQLVATRKDGSEFPCKIGIRKVKGTEFIVAFVQDITNEAKAQEMEEAKRASANMNKSILDASFDAMVVTDDEGTIVKVNRAMLDIFGYNSTKDVIGKGVEILVGEHAAMHKQYMQKFKDEDSSSTILGTKRQLAATREDGSDFPCRIGIQKVPGTTFIVAFIQDISNEVNATKLAEANLASARMNRSIMDSSFDAVIVTDLEGNIVKVNAAMLQIFRYDKTEDIVGQNVEVLVGPHAANHRMYMQKFAEKKGSSTTLGSRRELVATRSDGSEFPCKIGIRKVPETDFIVAFVQDLTMEINAEQSADTKQATAQMNRSILDSSFDAIVVADDEGKIVRVNKAMLKIFGWRKNSEVVGQNVSILVGEHARMHGMYMKKFREEGGSSTVLGTKRQLVASRRDGTTFPCRIGIRKVDGTDFIVAYIQDISWEVNAIQQARESAAAAATEEILKAKLGPIAEAEDQPPAPSSSPSSENNLDHAILWDLSMDAIIVTDSKGVITKVNAATLRMFGFESKDKGKNKNKQSNNALVGQNIDILLGQHAETYRTEIQSGGNPGPKRQPATRRDKSEFPCQLGMSKIADTDYFVVFLQDITNEVKALERALAFFNS